MPLFCWDRGSNSPLLEDDRHSKLCFLAQSGVICTPDGPMSYTQRFWKKSKIAHNIQYFWVSVCIHLLNCQQYINKCLEWQNLRERNAVDVSVKNLFLQYRVFASNTCCHIVSLSFSACYTSYTAWERT